MSTSNKEIEYLIINSSSEDNSIEDSGSEALSFDEKKSKLSKYSFLTPIIPTPNTQAEMGLAIAGIAAGLIFIFAILSSLQLVTVGLTFPLLVCAIVLAGLIIAGTSELREEPTMYLN